MPLWTRLWRNDDDETPSWGKVPGLQVDETVRLQIAGGDQVGAFGARVRAIGMKRIFLDLLDEAELPARTALTVSFARGDALYHFETRVVGVARTGSVSVAFPRQVVRLQRRQFYRLPLEAPTTFRVLGDDGRVTSAPYAARLVNLSGGGALLSVSKPPLPPGVTVAVRIPTGREGHSLAVEAEVLECRVASQGASHVYLSRLRFFGPPRLSEEDRNAIVTYIHEQQRLMLRTRKLLRS